MYWVFNDDQLKKAMYDYAERTGADHDEKQAVHNLLDDFMHSPELADQDMARSESHD